MPKPRVLTKEQAREVRRLYRVHLSTSRSALAERFGIKRRTIDDYLIGVRVDDREGLEDVRA